MAPSCVGVRTANWALLSVCTWEALKVRTCSVVSAVIWEVDSTRSAALLSALISSPESAFICAVVSARSCAVLKLAIPTRIETRLSASEPSALPLPAASVNAPLATLTTPLAVLLAKGVNRAV